MSSLSSIEKGRSFLQNAIVNSLTTTNIKQKTTIKQSVNVISEFNTNCNISENSPCSECINQFLQNDPNSNTDDISRDECSVWCECNISDSNLNTSLKILLNVETDKTDISGVISSIYEDVKGKFTKEFKYTKIDEDGSTDDSGGESLKSAISKTVTNIRKQFDIKTNNNFTQRVGGVQTLYLNTSGGDNKNIN